MSGSSTTTSEAGTAEHDHSEFAPITPGEVLGEEFLAEYGLGEADLAAALGVPVERVADIVRNRRPIVAADALRLSLFFGNSPEFWLNLQSHYDLEVARGALSDDEARAIAAHRVA